MQGDQLASVFLGRLMKIHYLCMVSSREEGAAGLPPFDYRLRTAAATN